MSSVVFWFFWNSSFMKAGCGLFFRRIVFGCFFVGVCFVCIRVFYTGFYGVSISFVFGRVYFF